MVADVAAYVPGYRLKQEVQFTPVPADQPVAHPARRRRPPVTHQVSVFLEVEGAAHYLPGLRRQPRHHDLGRAAHRPSAIADRARRTEVPA